MDGYIEHFGNDKVAAQSRASEMNRLAGYARFAVWPTVSPSGNNPRGKYDIVDKKTNKRYAWGSIYGTVALSNLFSELKKNAADSTTQAFPVRRTFSHEDLEASLMSVEDENVDALNHYGVLGMKWGVRHDRVNTAVKAGKKLKKLDAKVAKREHATERLNQKSVIRRDMADNAILFPKRKAKRAAKTIEAANRSHIKAQRATLKAKKWFDSMNEVLGKQGLETVAAKYGDIGKRYTEMKLDDMMRNTTSDASSRYLADYYRNRAK